MLMQFDPFRELDRLVQQVWGRSDMVAPMPMDAYRHGDTYVVHCDLPGIDPQSIDVSVEGDVLTVAAERHWEPVEGDDLVLTERRHGRFRRQLRLGDGVDVDDIHASYENGVLTLTIPLAERSRPRRIPITTGAGDQPAIEVEATAST